MTREEFKLIAAGLREAYRRDKLLDTPESFSIWYELLKDLDYETASTAAQMYMMQEHFPPAPADIRKKAAEMQYIASDLTEGEAWAMVRRALSNGSYGYHEEFIALPEKIQKAIGDEKQLQIWARDENFDESVTQALFLRSYRQVVDREKSLSVLPMRIRTLIEGTAQKLIGE